MIQPADGGFAQFTDGKSDGKALHNFLAMSRAKIATSFSHVRTTIAPGKVDVRLRSDHSGRHINHQVSA
jgi:hypothetical protein